MLKGRVFIQWVATDPYGDKAKHVPQEAADVHEETEEALAERDQEANSGAQEVVVSVPPSPDWPMMEDWEHCWPGSKDWFQGEDLTVKDQSPPPTSSSSSQPELGQATHSPSELMAEILKEQESDPYLHLILSCLRDGTLPKDAKQASWVKADAKSCGLLDRQLYWFGHPKCDSLESQDSARLAIPTSLTSLVMRAHHNDILGGHLGK